MILILSQPTPNTFKTEVFEGLKVRDQTIVLFELVLEP